MHTQVCWEGSDGLVLWRPVAPPGYVSLGVIATDSISSPPSLDQVACVREEALIEARLGQCVMFSPTGNLWSVANCGSTLVVAPPARHTPRACLRDLRMPVGVAPAALTAAQTLEPPKRVVAPELQETEDLYRRAIVMKALQDRCGGICLVCLYVFVYPPVFA